MARRGVTVAVITVYSSVRVGLRIEVEDDGLPAQLGEPDGLAVLVRELEVRRLIPW